MQQIATTSSDIFVELSNNIKAWNIACVFEWLRIKQHQIIKASNSIKASNNIKTESNRAWTKHGVTYYSSLDWLRKPVLLAVVGGLKQVNRRQLLTLTLFFLKCFSTKIKMLFSKNQKCYSTRIKW